MAVARVRTGVILILLGLLLLLNTTGMLGYDIWEFFLEWWPLLLIAIGIEKIFGATRSLKPLAYISPVIILVTVAYAVIAVPDGGTYSSDRRSFRWSVPAEAAVSQLDLEMDFGGGRLKVGGGADPDQLLEGQFYHHGRKPETVADRHGDIMEVSLNRTSSAVGISRRGREKWILKLSETVPVNLVLDAGAALVKLDFEQVVLNKLKLETGAADINMIFGTKSSQIECDIDCGAASIDMVIPAGAGLRLDRETVLTALTTRDLELVERGSSLETPDFDDRSVRILMTIESGVSSLRIRESEDIGVGSSI